MQVYQLTPFVSVLMRVWVSVCLLSPHCVCTGECAGAGLGEGQLPAPHQHGLTPVTQPLMTVCHCLCGGGIACTNDSLPCLMIWLLPHHLGATGELGL